MLYIDGKWFSNFLEKHKNRRILRDDLKNPDFLTNLGIKKPKDTAREHPEERFFEAFLLRSFLYRVCRDDDKYLEPFLIDGNWSDYAKAWKIGKFHLPFRGKIAFLVSEGKTKKLVCHPETSSNVDKILFEPGFLSLRIPGFEVIPNYKANVCQKLIEHCGSSVIKIEDLELIKNQTNVAPERFLVILESLGLLKRSDEGYIIDGPGLFCDEIRKTVGFNDLEKAARVILRRDSEKMMYVTSVLLWLESRERYIEPWDQSIGVGKKEEDYLNFAASETSLNKLAISNVFREFSKFKAFFEYYPRELKGMAGYSCYATLSCHVDSLGFIVGYLQGTLEPEHFFKTTLKREKFRRHVEYLLRFINADSLVRIAERKDLSLLRQKLTNSEIIRLSVNLGGGHDFVTSSNNLCLSNVFVVSKLPVKDDYFKEKVLETLKGPHEWKTAQGYFYYPDFRFIMSAMLGMNFNAFDRVLAYQIQNDIDFYSKLFLPILWGIKRKSLRIDDSLLSVVPEPFDSIALRY
jgi:hypothetical protein